MNRLQNVLIDAYLIVAVSFTIIVLGKDALP